MVSFWEDMQWQCSIPQEFYGGFEEMPWHCQNSSLLSRSLNGDKLYEIVEGESSPKKVRIGKNPKSDPEGEAAPSPSEKILSFSLSSSTKPIALDDDEDEIIAEIQSEKTKPLTMPDDFKDASFDDDKLATKIRKDIDIAMEYLNGNKDCASFLNQILKNVETRDIKYWSLRVDSESVKDANGNVFASTISIKELLAFAKDAKVIASGESGTQESNYVIYHNQMSASPGQLIVHKSYANAKGDEKTFIVIHETFHQLEGVGDLELARAAQLTLNPKKSPKIFEDTPEGRRDASIEFNQITKSRCEGLQIPNGKTFRF
ncbi:MAG: hypothetical protein KIS76_16175 [Pyrinomonadaceae bacterium]|nr:hypothetical protein [Pyrinomonadaceae bacterium]